MRIAQINSNNANKLSCIRVNSCINIRDISGENSHD
jgi:hypothetical protein